MDAGRRDCRCGWLYVRPVSVPQLGDQRQFDVAPEDVPEPGGAPFFHFDGKFFLVNLKPDEVSGAPGDQDFVDQGPGGLVALSNRCPHLNCSVRSPDDVEPYIGDLYPNCFRCPCHGATFSKGGARVFGPAYSGLDTARCTVWNTGRVTVDVSELEIGADDNAQRAVPYPS